VGKRAWPRSKEGRAHKRKSVAPAGKKKKSKPIVVAEGWFGFGARGGQEDSTSLTSDIKKGSPDTQKEGQESPNREREKKTRGYCLDVRV